MKFKSYRMNILIAVSGNLGMNYLVGKPRIHFEDYYDLPEYRNIIKSILSLKTDYKYKEGECVAQQNWTIKFKKTRRYMIYEYRHGAIKGKAVEVI